MDKKTTFAIFLILVLSLILRFYRLGDIPPSLNWDEVSHGYNAYSILKTGSDEWGKILPWDNFRAYGDYPLPVNLYLTIPSILTFGLNELSIRFPTAFLGSLLVIAQYFLTYFVTKNKKSALFSSLLMAIVPWTILPARGVFQSTIALFFFTWAIALLLASKNKPLLLPLAALFYGISAYSYHTARIVSVIFLPIAFVYVARVVLPAKINRSCLALSLAILAIFFIPLSFVLISPSGQARANWVFILDQGAINQINQMRANSAAPPQIKRLIYNKITYVTVVGAKNYLGYYSPEFLFTKGGTQYQFSLPGKGLLYWTLLPFLYTGVLWGLWQAVKKKNPTVSLVMILLFLAPIPAVITQGEYHVLRSSLLIPLLLVLTSLMLVRFLKYLRKTAAWYLLAILVVFVPIIVSLHSYLGDLFDTYPVKYSWAWQYSYKQVVEIIKKNYDSYDRFIITKKYGEPHEFILFFWPWDPSAYKNDPNLVRYYQTYWYWVDSFDKFIFVNDWEIKDKLPQLIIPGRTLLVTSPSNYTGGQTLDTINFLDNQPAFDIVKY
jgi:4-amino-4-deoxy-L-arabinose transferase-like glycosyltransferase